MRRNQTLWPLPPLGAAALLLALAAPAAIAQQPSDYTMEVRDVTAKVGEHATMIATLRLQGNHRLLESYNHRLSRLSSFDGDVAFGESVVHPTVRDGALVFEIDVEPTKAGKHPINGVVRFGYIEEPDSFFMVSVPLIANVSGTD